jgi:branched-chain amino acid transport system ATP-binding protein
VADKSILEVRGLCTYYGTSQVLFDVDLRAPSKGAIAILGRNGAGTTTLLRTIVGELQATRGEVHLWGVEETRTRTEIRIRRGLGYVPQEQAVFGSLTVRENLLIGSSLKPDASGIGNVLEIFPKLAEREDQRANTLSGGERKMLAIGRALLSEPSLLLLDEPTEGVWIGVVREIAERLVEMTSRMTLVLVEQHVDLALEIADYCYVLDRGRVVLEGSAEQLRNDPQLYHYLTP